MLSTKASLTLEGTCCDPRFSVLKTPLPMVESALGAGALAGPWMGSEGRRRGRGREFSVPVVNSGAHFKQKMNLWSRYLGNPDCTAKDMLWELRGFQTLGVEVEWAVTRRALSPGSGWRCGTLLCPSLGLYFTFPFSIHNPTPSSSFFPFPLFSYYVPGCSADSSPQTRASSPLLSRSLGLSRTACHRHDPEHREAIPRQALCTHPSQTTSHT